MDVLSLFLAVGFSLNYLELSKFLPFSLGDACIVGKGRKSS